MDCICWYGIPFNDLDCRHWLPYLTAEEIGQGSPKLTLDQGFTTEWSLPEDEGREAA